MNAILLAMSVTLLSAPPESGNHLVFPVTTDLQRSLLASPGEGLRDVKAYVLVNGIAVMSRDGMINAKALDLAAIRQQLAPFVDREKGVVCFNVCNTLPSKDSREEFLLWALDGFGRHTGFRHTRVGNSYMTDAFDWEKHIADVNEKSTEPDGDERAIGNDIVRAYPVRTILSRYLTSNADCVVEVLAPVEKETDSIEARIRDAVLTEVPKVMVKKKGKILFVVTVKFAARKATDNFVGQGSKELAELLGFKEATVQSRYAP